MAAASRILDVWIIDLQKVYTGVPFTVVTDWLQQGRLLAGDRVRLAGNQKWHLVDKIPALAPYLPTPAPLTAEDTAEALEPVELGLESPVVKEGEDEDVDMIPLIDVSLVLLIFFMMTSLTTGIFSNIATPAARHQLATISGDMYWLGMELKDDTTKFSLGKDSEKRKYLVDPTPEGDRVLETLNAELNGLQGEVKIRLRADKRLSVDTIKQVTLDLQELEASLNRSRANEQRLQLTVLGEVSEPAK